MAWALPAIPRRKSRVLGCEISVLYDFDRMAEKSKYVIALDHIQGKVFEFMKPLGFRKRGRSFNREADEKGIFEVVNFQTGPYELAPEIPPFRLNLYGRFTVNMGVLIKELYDLEEWHKAKDFYQEVDCLPRERLPVLLYGKDFWWELKHDPDELAQLVIEGFKTHGFAYFARYDTRKKFCENYGRFGDAAPRAPLDIALLVRHSDKAAGEKLFREYYRGEHLNPGHIGYLDELAARLNIKLD